MLAAPEVEMSWTKHCSALSANLFTLLHEANEGHDARTRPHHDNRNVVRLRHDKIGVPHEAQRGLRDLALPTSSHIIVVDPLNVARDQSISDKLLTSLWLGHLIARQRNGDSQVLGVRRTR